MSESKIAEQHSNLTPELRTLTHSAEFKEWFGDWENDSENASKLVDENGEPALVYFGGPSGITRLHGNNRNRTGSNQHGFYFTPRRNNARFYAQTLHDRETDLPALSSIYTAFLNIREPYVKQPDDGLRTESVDTLPTNYDGYINNGAEEIVVFSPDQVHFVNEEPLRKALNPLGSLAVSTLVK